MGTVSFPSSTLCLISGVANGIFVFWTERDWSRKSCYGNTFEKRVAMATFLRLSLCFVCDAHLWRQVSRTLL